MSNPETTEAPPTGSPTGSATPGIFVRNATGLVREVGAGSSTILNFIPGSPVFILGAGLFFALSVFPGGNFFVGLLLAVPIMLGYSYTFGLLTAVIPRSGGDYMLVSRIIGPNAGVISSALMTVSQLLSLAYIGIAFVTTGVTPALQAIGVLTHSNGMVELGTTLSAHRGWELLVGSLTIFGAAAIHIGGWRRSLRIQTVIFWFAMAGVAVTAIVLLLTTRAGFIKDFNSFALPFTHNADTYSSTIKTAQEAEVNTSPSFSFYQTIALLGVFGGFLYYTYFSSFIGGELRRARTLGTAHRMAIAGMLNVLIILLLVLVFFNTVGAPFLTAAFGGGFPTSLPAQPYYFLLVPIVFGGTPMAIFLALGYLLFWPLLAYMIFLQPTRTMFALSFDGLLPKAVTKVSPRTHTPTVALFITTVLGVAALAFSLYVLGSQFFQVLAMAALSQLTAQGIVGIAAVLLPKLRPEIYNSSVSDRRLLGIPAVVIAGSAAVIGTAVLYYVYWTYPLLGLPKHSTLVGFILGVAVVALVAYHARLLALRRRGIDATLAFAEIPPE
jgi:APA family basic amino acid/polyamine antiporter